MQGSTVFQGIRQSPRLLSVADTPSPPSLGTAVLASPQGLHSPAIPAPPPPTPAEQTPHRQRWKLSTRRTNAANDSPKRPQHIMTPPIAPPPAPAPPQKLVVTQAFRTTMGTSTTTTEEEGALGPQATNTTRRLLPPQHQKPREKVNTRSCCDITAMPKDSPLKAPKAKKKPVSSDPEQGPQAPGNQTRYRGITKRLSKWRAQLW